MSGQLYEPRLSSNDEIKYMIQYLTNDVSRGTEVYTRAAVDTLRWILGQRQAAPVTGLRDPATCARVRNEGYEAQVAMSNGGYAPVGALSMSYLNGVDDAAKWATGSPNGLLINDDWPFPRP
jgi:hypothetical protein